MKRLSFYLTGSQELKTSTLACNLNLLKLQQIFKSFLCIRLLLCWSKITIVKSKPYDICSHFLCLVHPCVGIIRFENRSRVSYSNSFMSLIDERNGYFKVKPNGLIDRTKYANSLNWMKLMLVSMAMTYIIKLSHIVSYHDFIEAFFNLCGFDLLLLNSFLAINQFYVT